MKKVLSYLREVATKKFIVLAVITILLAVTATLATRYASSYIYENFGEPPVIKDLLWSKLPHLKVMWLSEIFLVLSVVYMIIYGLFKKNLKLGLYASVLVSIFHLFRAGMIVLTPMGFPYNYAGFIHSQESIYNLGAFPSGHLSIPYLIFMITKSKIVLILTFLVGITLLLCRGHYSIDLIGALLLGYPIFRFSEKYLKRFFEND